MRLSIRHETLHRYTQPARSVIQKLRLTPRGHQGQHVVHWRIDVDVDCRLKPSQDAFGNAVHAFTSDGPHAGVAVTAIGEVDTFDTRGVVGGAMERFPHDLFLRSTLLTHADAEARELAARIAAAEKTPLDQLHMLLRALSPVSESERPGGVQSSSQSAGRSAAQSATQSQQLGQGPATSAAAEAQSHRFIATARLLDIPARYIAGYRLPDAGAATQGLHGWAEAAVPGLGWVGFDPVNGLCPDERYVRVAMGLDALDAAMIRAAQIGGIEDAPVTTIAVSELRPRNAG